MRPVSHTFVDSVRAPVVQVFAALTDPVRIPKWLPGCDAVESAGPFRKGGRFTARFGQRTSEFEIVDFSAPATFGWTERGQRKGTKLFLRLDVTGATTAVTVREVSTPRGFLGWVRGRFFERRHVQKRLQTIVQNLRTLLG
ncbi:MAG TPA: SRPBCC family protein [Gemmatimonadales bacterium]|nr:SRPBCC family protein [Gemmatimonadales bacterium]